MIEISKEYGYTYTEFLNTPINIVFSILKTYNSIADVREAKLNDMKRKHGNR